MLRYFALLLLPLTACAQQLPPGSKLLTNVPYVKDGGARQQLDVYVPPKTGSEKPPLLIWIHGGGWEGGAKSLSAMQIFAKAGFAVAAINYRLSTTEVFPAQILDCKAAIRWLRAHAGEYGYDPARIGVSGHSAGGHLAALVGTSGGVKEFDQGENADVSSAVQAVVDINGPTNLSFYGFRETGPLARLMGGTTKGKETLLESANAIRFVSSDDPPFYILHVQNDTLVPVKHAEALAAALRNAGVETKLDISPGEGHYPPEKDVPEKILQFFQRTLKFPAP